MSLISMVLLLSPSCSDLLVIKVLNLEQGEKVGLKRGLIPCCADSTAIRAASGRGDTTNDCPVPKLTFGR